MVDKRRKEDLTEDLRQRLAKYYHKRLNHAPISPLMPDMDEKLDKFYVPPKIFEKNHRKIGAAEKEKGTPVTSYRHLICKTSKFGDHVFIVGEAGMGKSSCATMCALKWANQFSPTNTINEQDENYSNLRSFESAKLERIIQSNSVFKQNFRPKTELDDQFQDDTFFQKVEFLFHLTLRDCCHLCDLTDIIQDQLINTIYQDDEKSAALCTLRSVLYNKKCVIIVDGLDEWTHPNETNYRCSEKDKVIPHLAPNIDATVLITSRPWRMSQQRVKDTSIDTYMEIEGTTDMLFLLHKTINSLNETVTENKTLPDFLRFIRNMKIEHLLSVPIISMLLVCLWFDGEHESSSLCGIYAYTIEMFVRKPLPMPTVSLKTISFPQCFKDKEHAHTYYSVIMELAQLAFTTLFSNDQTSSLVFKKVDVMAHDHLVFVLKSGILQETKAASLIKKSSSYSFIHKTVQEFLAALYMSHRTEEFYRVFKPYYENNTDSADVSQVFIFLCGLNIELANEMSVMISDRPSHSKEQIPPEVRTIFSGYVEAQDNCIKVSDIKLLLYRFDYLMFGNSELLNDLLLINKSKVRFIHACSETNETTLREVFICSTDTLTNVWMCEQTGKYDLSACNCLQDLCIVGSEVTDIVVNTKCLVSLDLTNVSERVQYSMLQSLQRESVNFKEFRIEIITNMNLFYQTLPRLKHLEKLNIIIADLSDKAFPLLPASLTDVYLYQVKMTAPSLINLIERLEKKQS
ncbi:uncharacterized protein LOC128222209 isoform X1 [Mya arenaria]|uniref:uncharacterized protein LOC128222209 isoform X1 n=1 Tax=Mya arenaria TaxID=6604 RepID=UPI0022E94655|nr:uncharacterized protein LOC128222209 isoform X1 [Mya arenaria]XP_052787090.1 uncharacterized protein LOC128222209 isoform X1 [Mya arenaria]XP_052787091.1 uncharacterized protein LOC128222209 isoform X1 [Mya arenaria]